MAMKFEHAKIITPFEVIEDGALVVGGNGKIDYLGTMDDASPVEGERVNIQDLLIVPGLIDIHVHGGHGITFGKPLSLAADLREYSKWVVESGVTGFLTTITAASAEELSGMIESFVSEFKKGLPGAQALGIHLEGPFMNIDKKGAQNPKWIRNPSLEEARMLLKAGQGWIKQMTLAPELPGAEQVANIFYESGVPLAIGHSAADYERASQALATWWTHVTHTFNAQTGFHHRRPGVVGAVLGSDEITAELIADMVHVHPGAMKVLVRCLGADRIVLVTDAMEAAGLPDGEYTLLGAKVFVSDGKATHADGTIASSTAMLNQCVMNINRDVGIPLPDAVKMATINPARVIGEADKLGSLEVGKQADLIVIDEDLEVYLTMVQGRVVYSKI
jgi:N-acetylglucosamine-6-phosphate deacetylase